MDLTALEPDLAARLVSAGAECLADPGETWRRLHTKEGRRATLIDRYAIEAASVGVSVAELTKDRKALLRKEVLQAQNPRIELIGGPGRDPIEVVAYDSEWPRLFRGWQQRLGIGLGPVAIRIDHIGSTAVPELAAKPVIDIQVSVPDPDIEDHYVPVIEGLGVPLRAREQDHRYFRPQAGRERDVQVHVCRSGSRWERDHLLFRDYLRAEPVARSAYQALKMEVAARFQHDRLAYNESKTAFVLDTLESAGRWATETDWTMKASR